MRSELWLLISVAVAALIVIARILVRSGNSGQRAFAEQAVGIYRQLLEANNTFIATVQPGLELAGTDPFAVPKAYRRFQELVEEAKAALADVPAPDDARYRTLWDAVHAYLEVVAGWTVSAGLPMV